MKKSFIIMLVLFVIFSLYLVSAITGSLGNAKMFLDAEVGETLEKYVLVKNVNDVPVNIKLSVSSDISKDVKLEDEEFELTPGEDRRVYFTIKARKPGIYEIRILVRFSEEGGKTGVGLSSVITLKVYGKGEMPEDELDEDELDEESEEDTSAITGNVVGESGISPVLIVLPITTILLFAALLFIILKTKRKKSKQRGKRSDRSS